MKDEIFMIKARRCKRCGRLLTSADAAAKGYGCQCAAKAKAEEAERAPLPGQISIEDFLKDMEE